jgi:small GTP-binding protein
LGEEVIILSFNKEALDTLYKLKKEILKSDNETLVSQIDHAIMKTYNNQLVLSFIGHYSAGKSSLINHLLDSEILPSSPVPTTSNTVQVQISDKENIQAFLNQYQYVQLNDYDELKRLNTKDLDITAINMDVKHEGFNTETVFQDTPGVDSKTDQHQEATNRFLLNSDYIFFTVEYNHVQSEQNLKMLKNISDLKIPVSLVINQVDKHDDYELPFSTFISRIKETLKDWGIELDQIFTTSIYESSYNEIAKLQSFIHSLESQKEDIQHAFYERIIKNIETKQLEYLNDETQGIKESLKIDDTLTVQSVKDHIKYLEGEIKKNEISTLHQDPETLRTHVSETIKKIVRDSYIFPHSVKSSVTEYLRIKAGDVKVSGLFGRKKKEAALLEESLREVADNFKTVINTEINAPINSFFGNINLTGQPFKYEWTNDILEDRDIPSLSNQFILNYLDKIKSFLVKDVSKKALEHLKYLNDSDEGAVKDKDALITQRDQYQQLLNLFMLMESIDTANYRHFYIHLDDEIDKLDLTEAVTLDLENNEVEHQEENSHFNVQYEGKIDLQAVYNVKRIIEDHPRYQDFKTIIEDKLERLSRGKANISVFGGFSAGKTTFINALMGENTLTTSPNPTTATITEINDHPNSKVTYKSKEELIDTLSTLSNLDHPDIPAYTKWIKKHFNSVPETYKPFLNGVLNYFEQYEHLLGETVEIPTAELIEKISTDEDATFIHKASVALNNQLTKDYTIIDSPGINSTNQRHTKETRNIISDSDLIIYVSYYNHVFSQSDESFLKYIRSIKGGDFPIIFIINAVDLMRNENDKEKVINYMSDTLINLEINHVIYPVSSKQALETNDEGFNNAKENITKIAADHVQSVQYQSLIETVSQLTYRIESNIRQFENKESEQARLMTQRDNLKTAFHRFTVFTVKPRLTQEIDVVLTFIRKRFELKLYDHLKNLITSNDAEDKDYLTKHQAIISNDINDFLTLEISTVFNAIYRFADELIQQLIAELNDELKHANTVNILSFQSSEGEEPTITIDVTNFKAFSKTLYQKRNQLREFRDTLLKLSSSIIDSIDIEALREQMEELIDAYLNEIEAALQPEINQITEELDAPLQEIKESDYIEDTKLLKSLRGGN